MHFSVILGFVLFSNAAACTINPFGTPPTPLLVRSTNFVYPTRAGIGTLSFSRGQTVDLACPGGRLVLGGTATTLAVVTATCVSGTSFSFNINNTQTRHSWAQIRCSANPTSTARFTGGTCESNGREVEVGYALNTTRFVRNMLTCFDAARQSPIYTFFELIPAINQQISGTPRPNWTQGSGIFTITNVNRLYTQATQRATINGLLGLPAASTQYVQNNNHFLSRGHLTARSDFFYASQQNSTFHFVNSLPQWQTFNGFNWDQAESDVQDYAERNNVRLQVWTGGFGVTTLPHATTGAQITLYLQVNGTQRRMPVPEIFWKVVYNPTSQRGVVLIGVNNPYKTLAQIDRFCDDRSDLLTWLNWQKDNQSRGFSWACTVTAFRRIVKDFPELRVSGLLF